MSNLTNRQTNQCWQKQYTSWYKSVKWNKDVMGLNYILHSRKNEREENGNRKWCQKLLVVKVHVFIVSQNDFERFKISARCITLGMKLNPNKTLMIVSEWLFPPQSNPFIGIFTLISHTNPWHSLCYAGQQVSFWKAATSN